MFNNISTKATMFIGLIAIVFGLAMFSINENVAKTCNEAKKEYLLKKSIKPTPPR